MSTVFNESTRIETWLRTVLNADPTINGIVAGRIYAGLMPQRVTTYPAIVFSMLSPGNDLMGVGPTRVWAAPLYLVKGIHKDTGALALQTLMDRVEMVLHAARGGTADARIEFCVRERPFRLTESDGDTIYQHLGSEWRVAARPLAA